ncbi:MAG: cardiolipin synthase [Anaerovoracaceae bacterium]
MKIHNTLWQAIFGRTTLLVILLLGQITLLVWGFSLLDKYIFIFNYIIGVAAALIILSILNARQNSSFKMVWIILILCIPLLGVCFYLFTRLQPGTQLIEKRIEKILELEKDALAQDQEVLARLEEESPQVASISKYLHDFGMYPTYNQCQVEYFPLGEDKFHRMIEEIKGARKFIFMEYFIVSKGYMWDTILDLLVEKVKEGVEVRFMYDGTCTLSLLPRNYPKKMEALGIQCKVFAPIIPFLSTYQNNRDHRKVLVIDGHTAFTGGVNLADEYINEVERFGHWKDTAIMIKGKGVDSFTLMFLQMWDLKKKSPINFKRYINRPQAPYDPVHSTGYVIPYGDSPFDGENVGERVYMDILYNAKKYVHIMTPYLIIDDEMSIALAFAAKKGVDVILMLPHIPDKFYAYILARTYYEELIEAGVKIYEYTPGFVHAKVFTSDDNTAVVGTINLDFRSLYLHFECAAYIYQNPVVKEIEIDFQNTLEKCQQITMEDCKSYSIFKKTLGKVLRIIAPLM